MPASGRQPTASAHAIMTASEGSPTIRFATVRPTSTDERATGRVFRRSTTPSDMSVATATATDEEANSADCANRPDMR